MSRTQLYLGGLLVLQVALILIFRSPFAGASAGLEPRPLLPALDTATPSVIEILGEDEGSIKLVRSGEEWTVESLDGFPASASKVEELLDNLRDLRVRRPVVSSGRHHDTFKVAEDEHVGRLRLWAAATAEPDADLFLGSSPNFRTIHVRRADEAAVYEVSGLSSYDLQPDPSGWIERELVEIDETRVVGLTLTNASGSFELHKQDGIWQLRADGDDSRPTLDQGQVDAFVRTAASLRLDDAIGALDRSAHGFTTPAATLVLRYSPDGGAPAEGAELLELTLEVGAPVADDESRRYVTRDGFDFSGTVWESSVRRLLEDTLDEFVGS